MIDSFQWVYIYLSISICMTTYLYLYEIKEQVNYFYKTIYLYIFIYTYIYIYIQYLLNYKHITIVGRRHAGEYHFAFAGIKLKTVHSPQVYVKAQFSNVGAGDEFSRELYTHIREIRNGEITGLYEGNVHACYDTICNGLRGYNT